MATSDIPIDITTASGVDLKFMKLYSSDTIKRIIKQQQDFERFDYDFVTVLPTKPKEMSADEWRRDAQEGCVVDLERSVASLIHQHQHRVPLLRS